jgi:hypothetical protein
MHEVEGTSSISAPSCRIRTVPASIELDCTYSMQSSARCCEVRADSGATFRIENDCHVLESCNSHHLQVSCTNYLREMSTRAVCGRLKLRGRDWIILDSPRSRAEKNSIPKHDRPSGGQHARSRQHIVARFRVTCRKRSLLFSQR